jgi:hypothetical protein
MFILGCGILGAILGSFPGAILGLAFGYIFNE